MSEDVLDIDFSDGSAGEPPQTVEKSKKPQAQKSKSKPTGSKSSRPAPQKKDFGAIIDQAATVAKAHNPKTVSDLEEAWTAGLTAAKAINKL